MFDKLFGKNKQIVIHSPIEGDVVSISEVNDPTFSEEILGKGIAIKPHSNRAVSPVNGKVTQMFDTGHAVSITSDDGVEILVHIGLDTVTLKGRHYKVHVKDGDRVKTGELLIEFDREAIQKDGFDTVTPVVICNTDDFKTVDMTSAKSVNEQDELIIIKK